MRHHQRLPAWQTRIRPAGTSAALLLVFAWGALAMGTQAAAATCPIDVASNGYTLAAAQKALAAVTSSCRTIVFTPGTYQFNATFKITASSVTVTAEPGAVIKPAAGGKFSEGLVKVNASGVTLADLTLDGSGAATDGIRTGASSTVITRTSVKNVGQRGIYILGSASDATVSGCTVNGFGDRGILTSAGRTTVDSCTVSGGQGHGMWAFSGADRTSFTNNNVSGNANMGMEFSKATNFTASGNVIHDNHTLGIHMLRSKTGTVSGNTVYQNKSNGIDSHGSTYITIENNKSYLNGGPRLPDTVEGQGIEVYCSQNIKVLSNTVWNNSQDQSGNRNGIQVADNNGQNGELLTRDIIVDRNLAYDDQASPTQAWAIRLGGNVASVKPDLNFITVTNNTGYGNINPGLYTGGLAPNATVTITNNHLGDGSNTVPGVPTDVTATAGDASATVTWSAPASNGGSAITGYTVTSSPGGFTAAAAATARSATVGGLTNGTSYSFTVTATNAVGPSAASDPSNSVTPQPAVTLTTVQETEPAVSYNTWAGITDPVSSGGSYRISETAGAKATVTFTATSITWLMTEGPDRGLASVTIDGVSVGTVDLYAANPTNASETYSGLTDSVHTIVIKVLGTKRGSATAANVTVDGFLVGATTTPVEDTSPTVTFDSWTGAVNASADGGTYRASATSGATVTFTFTGSRVNWITARSPRYGMASVSIDGGAAVTVDLYSATQQWRVVGWSFAGLSSGSHTLTIKVLGVKNAASSGTKVLVDATVIAAAGSADLAAAASGESAAAAPYAGEAGPPIRSTWAQDEPMRTNR
jgi:parallel beta-helix repeat protein